MREKTSANLITLVIRRKKINSLFFKGPKQAIAHVTCVDLWLMLEH